MSRKFSRKEQFDTVTGKWVRDVRSNNIITLGALPNAGTGALSSTTTDANTTLWVTKVALGSLADNRMYVLNGSSTICQMYIEAKKTRTLDGSKDAPLFIVPVSTTVSLCAETASTTTVFLTALKVPANSKLETV